MEGVSLEVLDGSKKGERAPARSYAHRFFFDPTSLGPVCSPTVHLTVSLSSCSTLSPAPATHARRERHSCGA